MFVYLLGSAHAAVAHAGHARLGDGAGRWLALAQVALGIANVKLALPLHGRGRAQRRRRAAAVRAGVAAGAPAQARTEAMSTCAMPIAFGQYWELTKPRVVALIVFTALVGMFLAVPGLPPLRETRVRPARHLAGGGFGGGDQPPDRPAHRQGHGAHRATGRWRPAR